MHLCFVAPRAWPVLSGDPAIPIVGGAEVQQSLLARLFAAHGHRVSMICLDYGQPQRARVDGVEVVKFCRMKAGLPVLRFLHPRLTSMWRAMREVGADIYYCRSASMWVGVLAEFCRRYGRRSIYAGASNKDFVPDVGGQLAYARDRWLYRRGIARRRRHRGAERGAARQPARHAPARRRGDPELLRIAPTGAYDGARDRCCGSARCTSASAPSSCSSSPGACRTGASSWSAGRAPARRISTSACARRRRRCPTSR